MPRGGSRENAGRKRKDEEDKAKRLTIQSLVNEFGSEENAFNYAAKQIKENDKQSFNFFKLLVEYAYGKPKDKIEIDAFVENDDIDYSSLSKETLYELANARRKP